MKFSKMMTFSNLDFHICQTLTQIITIQVIAQSTVDQTRWGITIKLQIVNISIYQEADMYLQLRETRRNHSKKR